MEIEFGAGLHPRRFGSHAAGLNKKPAVAASEAPPSPTGGVIAAEGLVEPVSEEIRISSEMSGKIREVAVDEVIVCGEGG